MRTRTFSFAFSCILILALASCGSKKTVVLQPLLDHNTFRVSEYSDDPTYGYTEKNPIKVGGVSEGPLNERRFLNALMGPNGEAITYSRLGSCCHFKTKKGFNGIGLLDMYKVAYKGLDKEIILYINMYDSELLKIPVGFKKKE